MRTGHISPVVKVREYCCRTNTIIDNEIISSAFNFQKVYLSDSYVSFIYFLDLKKLRNVNSDVTYPTIPYSFIYFSW